MIRPSRRNENFTSYIASSRPDKQFALGHASELLPSEEFSYDHPLICDADHIIPSGRKFQALSVFGA